MLRFARKDGEAEAINRMPSNTAALIRSKVEQYAADPASLGDNVTVLKGSAGIYRLRVGDWRIVFTEVGVVMAIVRLRIEDLVG